MLVNAYSSSVMPQAASHHQISFERWKKFKQQQNRLLFLLCFTAGIIMFIFPEQLLTILFLGKNNNQLFFTEATQLVKIISPVPLLIALNVLNVSELILEKKFLTYLGAGLFVLLISLLSIDALKLGLPAKYAGYYPIVIEGACLLIYTFIVQKIRNERSR
jgi:O-antigen/teichoic acid export membrane protein